MFNKLKCWALDHFYVLAPGGPRCKRCGKLMPIE